MRHMILVAALIATSATAVQAQSKISLQRAREIALQRVPNNTGVLTEELKTREGVLVYEFDVDVPGRTHREIRVNAQTGVIVSNQKEDDRIIASTRTVPNGTPAPVAEGDLRSHEPYKRDDHPGPTMISEADARKIALRELPNGSIKEIDLEREHGMVVWEIDVTIPGEKGFRELVIDANTGQVMTHKIKR